MGSLEENHEIPLCIFFKPFFSKRHTIFSWFYFFQLSHSRGMSEKKRGIQAYCRVSFKVAPGRRWSLSIVGAFRITNLIYLKKGFTVKIRHVVFAMIDDLESMSRVCLLSTPFSLLDAVCSSSIPPSGSSREEISTSNLESQHLQEHYTLHEPPKRVCYTYKRFHHAHSPVSSAINSFHKKVLHVR